MMVQFAAVAFEEVEPRDGSREVPSPQNQTAEITNPVEKACVDHQRVEMRYSYGLRIPSKSGNL